MSTDSMLPPHERQALEEALRLSRERYALADAAGDGHTDWIVATDEFYGSPRFMEMCGLPPDTRFNGRAGFIALFPFHPEDKDRIVQAMSAHYAGQTVRLEMEMRLLVHGETRWAHVTGVCTRDANGELVRWTSSMTDVTARKKAEAALRESEQRFALAVNASNDGIWDWDLAQDAMFISERAQSLLGLAIGPTVRRRADWLAVVAYHPNDAPRRMRHIEDHLAGLAPVYDGEWRVLHADGVYRWVRIRGLCQRDAAGHPMRMAGSVSDIDGQKRAEAAVRQTQRLEAMGTLAGGIAHDFNNILGAILGYGEMALRDAPMGGRLRRDLNSIMTAGERGRALVERILAFSRSGVGERVAVHVQQVVAEALELVRARLPAGQTIESDLQVGRAAMLGDPTQVHQVVMNLASNALQAMAHKAAGGRLQVSLALRRLDASKLTSTGTLPPGEYLLLRVADEGSGIAPDIIERIFDPFFTTKEVGVGTGLGLSLVHGIVTEVGGAVDVVSTPGKGAEFSVFLPRSGDAPDDVAPVESLLPRGQGQRVLIVDDEEPLLSLACETLSELGYQTSGHTSSLSALDTFRASPHGFDALITDERMPAMAGSVLISEVRALRPTLPVLLVSGYPAEAQAQADVVLKKPLSARELASALARLLT
jgi:PAS domain S-box-containing protein